MHSSVLGVAGSPRKKSNSTAMLLETLKGVQKEKISTELMILSKSGIQDCCGDDYCWHRGTCETPDNTVNFYEKLLNSKAFVFATPNWFNNVSSWMKKFIDRTNPIAKKRLLEEKHTVLIIAGGYSDEANQKCENILREFCRIHRLNIIGSARGYAEKPGEILENEKILKECFKLGKKLALEIKNEK